MYELWIEKNGTYHLADLGDDTPAMNIQRNDIAELKDRQADYSQALRLPKTKKNREIFDFIDEFTIISDMRHKRLGCRLYADGCTILGEGGLLKFVSITSESFEVQLMGGARGFFERLQMSAEDGQGPKTINDLQFDEIIRRGEEGIHDSAPGAVQDRHSFFGIADFSIHPGGNGSLKKKWTDWHIEGQLPFIKYKSIINRILEENTGTDDKGYTLLTDIANDVEYTNACIPFDSIKPDKATNDMKDVQVKLNESEALLEQYYINTINSIRSFYVNFQKVSTKVNMRVFRAIEMKESSRTFYPLSFTCWVSGSYTFNIKIKLKSQNGSSIKMNFLVYSGKNVNNYFVKEKQIISESAFSDSNGIIDYSYKNPEPLILTKYETLVFFIKVDNTAEKEISMTGFEISVVDFTATDTTDLGNNIAIQSNLPDMTQYDFFKAFLQIYGLTVDVDDQSKQVKAYTFNHIKNNKSKATDWSNKYQRGSGKQKFTVGNYAAKNLLKYKTEEMDVDTSDRYMQVSEGVAQYMHGEKNATIYYANSENIKIKVESSKSFPRNADNYYILGEEYNNLNMDDIGILRAKDINLKDEADLFELPFEAVENMSDTYLKNYLCKIRRYDPDSDSFEKDRPPKLLLFVDSYSRMFIYQGKDIIMEAPLHYVASVANGYSLQAKNLINKYYPVLEKDILQDMRFIEDAEFLLTPQDIEKFDPFIPIYIDYFGSYFYINKIKNFKRGVLTKVDLIKI